MAVYVYSITGSSHPRRLEGLGGVGDPPRELRTVEGGSLTAVVSDAPEPLRPKRRDLAAHHAVQERLMADGVVLPLRFGLTAPDDEAVRAALEERADEYRTRLRALRGCVEYHVKAAQQEESMLRQILQQSEEARRLNEEIRSGADRPDLPLALGELVAREVQVRQNALATRVVETLRPYAREERSSEPTGEDFVNVSFLVDHTDEEGFVSAERGLVDDLGDAFDVRVRGPLPAYSFV
ncbi:GvpL/GvpF family gas vesicle protein [Streptomyces hebeiensis]|uniref:GvpL/GvpF family gas vesicle protein n=1 Tax=Streptomyces hebeiensis TaxID=229486 RepID=A0ABN1UF99_9ACTN